MPQATVAVQPNTVWIVQWDDSHIPVEAGISLTISHPNQPPILMASILVTVLDANHTKALGVQIATLLLALLTLG